MTTLGSEVNIDLSTSCTKDQAVMRLLGWSQEQFTSTKINLPEVGLWLDQLPNISHQTMDLGEELKVLHERARQEYLQAFPPEAFTQDFDPEKHVASADVFEDLIEKQEALEHVKALIVRAREHAMDIDEELDKGGDSRLRIDKETTQATGKLHITLRSLERWRKEFYADTQESDPLPLVQSTEGSKSDLLTQLSKAVSENAKAIGSSDLSIYITLAFAIEAIAEKLGSPYGDKDELPVISQIAQLIAGKYQNKDGSPLIRGQGLDMIRKRLTLALKVKPSLPRHT